MKCADLSKSPVHKAAIGKLDSDRGISIRFPRLLRERLDKDPEQATTSDQASKSNSSVLLRMVIRPKQWTIVSFARFVMLYSFGCSVTLRSWIF